tara:strand:- start:1944 stop:2738 length:795 start_codon:yes stop_codon:yes gene_type:complete
MIVKEDFLKNLRSSFDLNIYEAKIWTALLSKGVATAGELSDISNVPRSRCYDVLESLEKRGFVVMKLGKPIKYIAVEPKEVVSRVKKDIQLKADSRVKSIDNVGKTDMFTDLNHLYTNGINHIDPSTISGTIKGRNNIHNHLESMIKDAKESVTLVTSSNSLLKKSDNLKFLFKKLKDRNVKIKVATQITKETEQIVSELKKYADIKNTKKVNGRFLLVDNSQVLFMVNHDEKVHDSYDIGVWVTTPYFASAMQTMFDLTWSKL